MLIKLIDKRKINLLLKLLFIYLFFLIQSCSSIQIGEDLSKTFSDSNKEKLNEDENFNNKNKSISRPKDNKRNDDFKEINLKQTEKIRAKSAELYINPQDKKIKTQKYKAQSYRIILKLSAVNPSAPAETVTRALRKAGVQFEVEKIERFGDQLPANGISRKR